MKFSDVATEFEWDADVVALRTSVVEQYLQEETLCTLTLPLPPPSPSPRVAYFLIVVSEEFLVRL